MTTQKSRLEEIEGRLSKATPGPWGAYAGCIRQDRSWCEESEIVLDYDGDRPSIQDAEFIAAAPADVAYLLAELRKAQEVLRHAQEVAWAKGATSAGMNLMALQVAGINPNPYRAAVADATGGERG